MIKVKEIAWLGGLLEGEGCFMFNRGRYPQIILGMGDEDVVVRAASLMKTRVYRSKTTYRAQVHGACAIGWMMTLYYFLHSRRRDKITEVIKFWKDIVYSRAPNGTRTMATCHPDRVIGGHGLCRSCYNRQYYKEKKLQSQSKEEKK